MLHKVDKQNVRGNSDDFLRLEDLYCLDNGRPGIDPRFTRFGQNYRRGFRGTDLSMSIFTNILHQALVKA